VLGGGVFISYRRDDSGGFAGRVYDRLVKSLGRDSVFFDVVDDIRADRDFVKVLSERVGRCDALIAVIGRNWVASADNGNRRLDDPNDFVRVEIESALARKIRVIPVLVDGAAMPRADDLPDCLKKFPYRQGIEISHTRFDADVKRLTRALAFLDEELTRATPPKPNAWRGRSASDKKPS
jgi:hypothetical protein